VIVALEELAAEELRRTIEHLRGDEPVLALARRLRIRIEAEGSPETAADRLEDVLAAPPVAHAA